MHIAGKNRDAPGMLYNAVTDIPCAIDIELIWTRIVGKYLRITYGQICTLFHDDLAEGVLTGGVPAVHLNDRIPYCQGAAALHADISLDDPGAVPELPGIAVLQEYTLLQDDDIFPDPCLSGFVILRTDALEGRGYAGEKRYNDQENDLNEDQGP